MKVKHDSFKVVNYWTVIEMPINGKLFRSKFFLRHKSDHLGENSKYSARLVICGNVEFEYHEESSFPILHVYAIKLVTSVVKQRSCWARHYDAQRNFPNGEPDGPMLVEFEKYIYGEYYRSRHIMKLARSLYRLKDAARIR